MSQTKSRQDDIFQTLTNSEINSALNYAISNSISLVGKCDDNTLVIVKPKPEGSSVNEIQGLLKSSNRVNSPQAAIFSFVVDESKYLFKADLNILHGKTVTLGPLSRFYCIQRRNNERLKIPQEYYALFKFTHINRKPQRSFGKIKNISVGGVAIVYRSEAPKIVAGDVIRGALTLSLRPPEDVELLVKHVRKDKEGEVPIQLFGCSFVPEGSPLLQRKLNMIITDIYRDIMKNMDDPKSK